MLWNRITKFASLCMSAILCWGCAEKEPAVKADINQNTVFHDFTMESIDGRDVPLSEYRGQVALVVNTASKCGYTKQYEGLQKLYETYDDRGFVVLGFPANNFMGQEPGTNEEIAEFCSLTYNVTFPMFAKISVADEDKHPLYQYLTSEELHPGMGGAISWNFNKFLIDKSGNVIARYGSNTTPEDAELIQAIEQALGG